MDSSATPEIMGGRRFGAETEPSSRAVSNPGARLMLEGFVTRHVALVQVFVGVRFCWRPTESGVPQATEVVSCPASRRSPWRGTALAFCCRCCSWLRQHQPLSLQHPREARPHPGHPLRLPQLRPIRLPWGRPSRQRSAMIQKHISTEEAMWKACWTGFAAMAVR